MAIRSATIWRVVPNTSTKLLVCHHDRYGFWVIDLAWVVVNVSSEQAVGISSKLWFHQNMRPIYARAITEEERETLRSELKSDS